jgi:predicted dehydrogenase
MKKIRWGIIGCGNVCEVKGGPAFAKARDSALVAVMRRNGELARDYAKRHGVPRWYDDAQELIEDSEVDAVCVATPPGSHKDYALAVAQVGKPCWVEKPMARNFRECQEMVEAFGAKSLPLFVAYYRRRLPRFVKAKELIDSGRLGVVTGVMYRMTRFHRPEAGKEWRLQPEESGGGLLLDVGSHTLDILDFLLGRFVEYAGSASNFSDNVVEDAVSIQFRTERGVLGTAQWNFAGSCREDLITIDGTEARLEMSTFGNEPLRLIAKEKMEEFDHPNPPHVQQPLIQSAVDQLLGRGECPSTGDSAARTSRVMDASLSAYYGGRDDDFWNRPQTWPRGK